MLYAHHDFKLNLTGATLSADAQNGCDMILSELAKAILLNALQIKTKLVENGFDTKNINTSNELASLLIDSMADNLLLRKDCSLIVYKTNPFEKEKIKGYKKDIEKKKVKTKPNSAGFETTYVIDKAKVLEQEKVVKIIEDGLHKLYTTAKGYADKENRKIEDKEKKINYLNLIKEDLNSKMSSYKKIYSMADGSQKKEESILLPTVLILGVTSWLIYKYAEIVR